MIPRLGAVLLAGGRATRLGGADKPLLRLGGRTLLDAAVAAARSVGADPIVVVGPVSTAVSGTVLVREDPPFSGPAAAVVTALDALAARVGGPAESGPGRAAGVERTLLLACDLEHPDAVVRRLGDALGSAPGDGICLADPDGRAQWLAGVYDTAALRRAAAVLPDRGAGASLRDLLAGLALTRVAAPEADLRDLDTWEDVERARERRDART